MDQVREDEVVDEAGMACQEGNVLTALHCLPDVALRATTTRHAASRCVASDLLVGFHVGVLSSAASGIRLSPMRSGQPLGGGRLEEDRLADSASSMVLATTSGWSHCGQCDESSTRCSSAPANRPARWRPRSGLRYSSRAPNTTVTGTSSAARCPAAMWESCSS